MAKVSIFIDGFNVYHALNDWDRVNNRHKYRNLLWLNYRIFAEQFIQPCDTLENVFYFTALAKWRPDSLKKHKTYINALKQYRVEPILGNFKPKQRYCSLCKKSFTTHEEKQTDVNISIFLLREAVLDRFETAFIFGADSDLIPAITTVKTMYPKKKMGAIIPIDREKISKEIRGVCDFYRYTKKKHYINSQLPDTISLPDGSTITKPSDWV